MAGAVAVELNVTGGTLLGGSVGTVGSVHEGVGNGTGHPQGVGKLTRTLTRKDRVLDLTG